MAAFGVRHWIASDMCMSKCRWWQDTDCKKMIKQSIDYWEINQSINWSINQLSNQSAIVSDWSVNQSRDQSLDQLTEYFIVKFKSSELSKFINKNISHHTKKVCFLLAEETKEVETLFLTHFWASVQEIRLHGTLVVFQFSCCCPPLPDLPPTHHSSLILSQDHFN